RHRASSTGRNGHCDSRRHQDAGPSAADCDVKKAARACQLLHAAGRGSFYTCARCNTLEGSMSLKSAIRTAVFPVAGRATRCLPATKASPKEMLPVVDKPLIQYAVEEALAAGASRLVFITGASKRAIEDHFDSDPELEGLLESQGKSDLLNQIRSVLP